jgi:hypothetical protein
VTAAGVRASLRSASVAPVDVPVGVPVDELATT